LPALLAALFLLPACVTADRATPAPQDHLACRDVEGADEVVSAGTVVLLGEMHGTAESPGVVFDLACDAFARDLSVTVGLEILMAEQARVDAYMDSAGTAEDRERLLSGPFWQDEYQDGRRSVAKLALIEELRQARSHGEQVHVVLIDRPHRPEGPKRDAVMADRIEEVIEARPDDFVVVLTGNIHNRILEGTSWDPDYQPMGALLKDSLEGSRVIALNVSHPGGTAWICPTGDPASCHAREIPAMGPATSGPEIFLSDDTAEEERAYDGYYGVSGLTASPPAVERLRPEG